MKIVSAPTSEMLHELNIKIVCLNSEEGMYRNKEIINKYNNEVRNKYDELFIGWDVKIFKNLHPKIRVQIYKEQQKFIKKYNIF